MSRPAPTPADDLDLDMLDFGMLELPGAKPRTARPELDKLQCEADRAVWLVDQGIVDADPLSNRNRK